MLRVFHDRLVNQADKDLFIGILREKLIDIVFANYSIDEILSIRFGNYMNLSGNYVIIEEPHTEVMKTFEDKVSNLIQDDLLQYEQPKTAFVNIF